MAQVEQGRAELSMCLIVPVARDRPIASSGRDECGRPDSTQLEIKMSPPRAFLCLQMVAVSDFQRARRRWRITVFIDTVM